MMFVEEGTEPGLFRVSRTNRRRMSWLKKTVKLEKKSKLSIGKEWRNAKIKTDWVI
jgi:hypothetical protein